MRAKFEKVVKPGRELVNTHIGTGKENKAKTTYS